MNYNATTLRQSLSHCLCNNIHHHWIHGSTHKLTHPARVVAYIRSYGGLSEEKQLAMIQTFCREYDYDLVNIFQEHSIEPGRALSDALNALDTADALIATDLERFVYNHNDRLRDLKPLIHNFFCHTNRYLLTICEGVDTSTPAGQASAVEMFSTMKDFDQ